VSNIQNKMLIVGFGWLGKPLGMALQKEGYLVSGTCRSAEKQLHLADNDLPAEQWEFNPTHPVAPAACADTDVLIITLPPGGNYTHWHAAIHLLCAAVRQDATIIFTSTTGVYRMGLEDRIAVATEDLILKDNPLLEAERLVQASGRPNVILRLAGLAGGERRASRFLAGKKGVKAAKAPVNLVHREDVIQAICACIAKGITNQVINICSDLHPAKQDYYTAMAIRAGLEPPQFEPSEESSYVVDNRKMKELLGIQLKFPDPFDFE
jgi:nucleoside-diphosphate-sugar epimerase